MTTIRSTTAMAAVAGSLIVGGAIGATAFGPGSGNAATTPSSSAATPRSGTFTPNENATHEAGESAAREAQEDAGQVPSVP